MEWFGWTYPSTYTYSPGEPAYSQNYNSGGYSGTLQGSPTETGNTGYTITNHVTGQNYLTYASTFVMNYSGTVIKPASDTRIYGQDYQGVTYFGGQKCKYMGGVLC